MVGTACVIDSIASMVEICYAKKTSKCYNEKVLYK